MGFFTVYRGFFSWMTQYLCKITSSKLNFIPHNHWMYDKIYLLSKYFWKMEIKNIIHMCSINTHKYIYTCLENFPKDWNTCFSYGMPWFNQPLYFMISKYGSSSIPWEPLEMAKNRMKNKLEIIINTIFTK